MNSNSTMNNTRNNNTSTMNGARMNNSSTMNNTRNNNTSTMSNTRNNNTRNNNTATQIYGVGGWARTAALARSAGNTASSGHRNARGFSAERREHGFFWTSQRPRLQRGAPGTRLLLDIATPAASARSAGNTATSRSECLFFFNLTRACAQP